jgi:antitoxin MazE
VSKWGNNLAIRLPATVVEALELKDGDQIEIRIAGQREFEVRRDCRREDARNRTPATSAAPRPARRPNSIMASSLLQKARRGR